MKILIVDDSGTMRNIVKKHLRKAGYDEEDMVEARCADEATSQVSRDLPDMIITDIDMPGLSGLEMVRQFQDDGIDIPFGVATAQKSIETMMEAMELGARFMVHKPYTTETLQRAMKRIEGELEEKKQRAVARSQLETAIEHLQKEKAALQSRLEIVEEYVKASS